MVELNTLVSSNKFGLSVAGAVNINDRGEIAGSGADINAPPTSQINPDATTACPHECFLTRKSGTEVRTAVRQSSPESVADTGCNCPWGGFLRFWFAHTTCFAAEWECGQGTGLLQIANLMHTVHSQNKTPKPSASPQHEHRSQSAKNNSPHSARRFLTHKQVPPAQLVLLRIVRAQDWRPPPRGLKKQARSISLEAGKQSPVCF